MFIFKTRIIIVESHYPHDYPQWQTVYTGVRLLTMYINLISKCHFHQRRCAHSLPLQFTSHLHTGNHIYDYHIYIHNLVWLLDAFISSAIIYYIYWTPHINWTKKSQERSQLARINAAALPSQVQARANLYIRYHKFRVVNSHSITHTSRSAFGCDVIFAQRDSECF